MTKLILPYVTADDAQWRKDFDSTGRQFEPERFRDWGTLRYLLRSYAENIPWAEVVLVVSNPSQAPAWFDGKVVLHEDFIPKEYLPTFNSGTIEEFLPNLPFDDDIVYTNDDIFALRPMRESDFFLDGAPRLNFKESDGWEQNVFRRMVRTSLDAAADVVGVPRYAADKLLKADHGMQPIARWQLEIAKNAPMEGHVNRFRDASDILMCFYGFIAYFEGRYAPSERKLAYKNPVDRESEVSMCETIRNSTADMICVNDHEMIDENQYHKARAQLVRELNDRFPAPCKYEKPSKPSKKTRKALRVIVATKNGASRFKERMYPRLCSQTCQDFHLVVVDDCSHDGSYEELKALSRIDKLVQCETETLGAGHARNLGMDSYKGDKYTLFVDDDDDLWDDTAIERILALADANGDPDLISLMWVGTNTSKQDRGVQGKACPTMQDISEMGKRLSWGMPWTKAVKTARCARFPEDMLLDDCAQHIETCDSCETHVMLPDAVYEWRRRGGSTSQDGSSDMVKSLCDELGYLSNLRGRLRNDWAKQACDRRFAAVSDSLDALVAKTIDDAKSRMEE